MGYVASSSKGVGKTTRPERQSYSECIRLPMRTSWVCVSTTAGLWMKLQTTSETMCSNFAFLNIGKYKMIDKVKEVNCAECNMVKSNSCRTLFCSEFIVYSLSSDPLRLYIKENRKCPKNVVKYTIKYVQYIFSVHALHLSWPQLTIYLVRLCLLWPAT